MPKDIITIYEDLLSGKTRSFPNYTWAPHNGGFDTFKRLFRYLILEKLNLSRDEVLAVLEKRFFRKWKLYGGLSVLFNSSPIKALQFAFPEWEVQPWEGTISIASNYWTNEQNRIDAVRWVVLEKLKWDKETFINNFTFEFFKENKLTSLPHHYSSAGELITIAFPEWNFTVEEFVERRYKSTSEKLKVHFNEARILKNESGETKPKKQLTAEQVSAMRDDFATGQYKTKEIAEKYGVSVQQTYRVLNGTCWGKVHQQ